MQVSLHHTSGVTRLKDAFQIPAQLAQRSARPDCAQGIQLQKRPLNRFCLADRQFHRVAERRYPHRLAPIVGSPVKVVRPHTEAEVEGLRKSTQSCVSNWKRFATGPQTEWPICEVYSSESFTQKRLYFSILRSGDGLSLLEMLKIGPTKPEADFDRRLRIQMSKS